MIKFGFEHWYERRPKLILSIVNDVATYNGTLQLWYFNCLRDPEKEEEYAEACERFIQENLSDLDGDIANIDSTSWCFLNTNVSREAHDPPGFVREGAPSSSTVTLGQPQPRDGGREHDKTHDEGDGDIVLRQRSNINIKKIQNGKKKRGRPRTIQKNHAGIKTSKVDAPSPPIMKSDGRLAHPETFRSADIPTPSGEVPVPPNKKRKTPSPLDLDGIQKRFRGDYITEWIFTYDHVRFVGRLIPPMEHSDCEDTSKTRLAYVNDMSMTSRDDEIYDGPVLIIESREIFNMVFPRGIHVEGIPKEDDFKTYLSFNHGRLKKKMRTEIQDVLSTYTKNVSARSIDNDIHDMILPEDTFLSFYRLRHATTEETIPYFMSSEFAKDLSAAFVLAKNKNGKVCLCKTHHYILERGSVDR